MGLSLRPRLSLGDANPPLVDVRTRPARGAVCWWPEAAIMLLMGRRGMWTLAIGLLALLALVACSSPPSQTWTGQVTTLTPRLCVGRADAAGDCFVTSSALPVELRIGSCVTVTFTRRSDAGPANLQRIAIVPPDQDRSDCVGA
jgi:hypothetical protein